MSNMEPDLFSPKYEAAKMDPEIAALRARVAETRAAFEQAQRDLQEACRARCGVELGDIIVGRETGKRWVVTRVDTYDWPVTVYGYPEAKSADKPFYKLCLGHRQVRELWRLTEPRVTKQERAA